MTATSQQQETVLPTGTWNDDTVHSSASFAVKHMVVSTFRGRFEDLSASLTVDENGQGKLVGTVDANSIVVKDENLGGHLKSPDFFDTEKYPELRFESTSITRNGGELVVQGDLTIKGNTHSVEGRGSIAGPHENIAGKTSIGLALQTTVDRTQFGLEWNAPLPKGGFALDNDVELTIELELVQA
ncbi:MAG: hypothetical protein QOJ07_3346 [Thermoleophilaceae bacterium]|jgi:polyisoprenoid-binding protein YceI|nr:hypothetical protein [Thermoleophilaceae bacterium]